MWKKAAPNITPAEKERKVTSRLSCPASTATAAPANAPRTITPEKIPTAAARPVTARTLS
jgi:hypothetical protein